MNILKKNYKYILYLILSAAFIFLYSVNSSPIYNICTDDAAQFRTIGFSWANGLIPYKDVWDHKGPIIFFINLLHYKFLPIWVLQIFCMFINICFIEKICILFNKKSIFSIFFTLSVLSFFYKYGATCEEFCLPLIFICLYLQLKYFLQKNTKHNKLYALVYGLSFAICFYIKFSTSILICCGILFIFIRLLLNKEYKDIIKNLLFFILGFLIISTPIIIYFSLNDCLYDMFYATFIFNLIYGNKIIGTFNIFSIFMYIPIFFQIIVCIIFIKKKNFYITGTFILCTLLNIFEFIKLPIYLQYCIPSVVFLPLVIIHIKENILGKIIFYTLNLLMFISFFTSMMMCNVYYEQNKTYDYEELIEYVDDSFIAYGDVEIKSVYVENNILPACKYFANQPWHANFNENLKEDIRENIILQSPKYILMNKNRKVDFLDNYIEYKKSDKFILYKNNH